MPRFNAKRWRPGHDTSEGYRTVDPRRIVLNTHVSGDTWGCPCGCGEMPKGRSATFAMGHDARLRGKLIRAHLQGVEILQLRDGERCGDPIPAIGLAEHYGWEKYLEAAVLRREGKNREVLQRAMGSTRLVQVGRWEYTGQVAAVYRDADQDYFEIEYVTRAGGIKRVRVPADEAPLAQEEGR